VNNISENLSTHDSGLRIVEVGDGDVHGVPVCTKTPIVEEPDDCGTVVVFKRPARRSMENLSSADRVARNRLVMLIVRYPEIRRDVVAMTNHLLDLGKSFSETFFMMNGFAMKKEPEIKAYRAERLEKVRNGTIEPENDLERCVAETRRSKAEAEAARARADAAQSKAEAARARAEAAEAAIERGYCSRIVSYVTEGISKFRRLFTT
jgi:hypothetical protein